MIFEIAAWPEVSVFGAFSPWGLLALFFAMLPHPKHQIPQNAINIWRQTR
jgi:hypothetical protein